MTFIITLMLLLVPRSFGSSVGSNYTGSTPASALVRNFLGISLTDSIDFIRWNLAINENKYKLTCLYGISKPNTNGFYYGGKKVMIGGPLTKENNIYVFQNGPGTLKMSRLNDNLLHVLNKDNSLMIGNAGWSYALNNLNPIPNDQLMIITGTTPITDSMGFQGRTPCGIPGIATSQICYKLKWNIILYGNKEKKEPLSYHISGTGYRADGGKKGKWIINTRRDGKIVYILTDEKSKPFLHLLKLDDGVLIFTDDKGNLLVGDQDFSYTLNRKF